MTGALHPARSAVDTVRVSLQAGRRDLRAEFFASSRPYALLHGHARLIDTTLQELWRNASMPHGATLVAVGGYGRSELFPYSDIDILVLLGCEPTTAEKSKLEALRLRTFVAPFACKKATCDCSCF